MAQVVLSVLQSGHAVLLLTLRTADCNSNIAVPPIRADVRFNHLDTQQPRVVRLEADDLAKFLPNSLGNP